MLKRPELGGPLNSVAALRLHSMPSVLGLPMSCYWRTQKTQLVFMGCVHTVVITVVSFPVVEDLYGHYCNSHAVHNSLNYLANFSVAFM